MPFERRHPSDLKRSPNKPQRYTSFYPKSVLSFIFEQFLQTTQITRSKFQKFRNILNDSGHFKIENDPSGNFRNLRQRNMENSFSLGNDNSFFDKKWIFEGSSHMKHYSYARPWIQLRQREGRVTFFFRPHLRHSAFFSGNKPIFEFVGVCPVEWAYSTWTIFEKSQICERSELQGAGIFLAEKR